MSEVSANSGDKESGKLFHLNSFNIYFGTLISKSQIIATNYFHGRNFSAKSYLKYV